MAGGKLGSSSLASPRPWFRELKRLVVEIQADDVPVTINWHSTNRELPLDLLRRTAPCSPNFPAPFASSLCGPPEQFIQTPFISDPATRSATYSRTCREVLFPVRMVCGRVGLTRTLFPGLHHIGNLVLLALLLRANHTKRPPEWDGDPLAVFAARHGPGGQLDAERFRQTAGPW